MYTEKSLSAIVRLMEDTRMKIVHFWVRMIFLRIVAALPEVQLLYWRRDHRSTNLRF